MTFRNDINGLRAIAVIAVVLFHFNANWLPGGFAGVDVFFVISGFLMTGIIFKGIGENRFSIWQFYKARARRILPALAILCLLVLLWGWFFLDPITYSRLAKHAASSVGFVSNFAYLRESGYFDVASHEKWLLHTWSLSTEWQFYLLYPVLLVALRRLCSLNAMKLTILVLAVVGFIFCVYSTYKWPDASYYMLPARSWEMLLGGVAYLYPLNLANNYKRFIEIIGVGLIVGSFFVITGEDPWPGYLAIFAVLGSFLVIQAQQNNSVFTNNIVFQKLGAWSYSIYLWHWPLVVAIYYFVLPESFIYLGLVASILLGYLSYRYVETFNRNNNSFLLTTLFQHKPIYLFLVVCVFAGFIIHFKGVGSRSENPDYSYQLIKDSSKANHGLSKTCEGVFTLSKDCRTSDNPEIAVWGDSYAMHIVNSIVASNPDPKVIQFTKSQCGPFFNITRAHTQEFVEECLEFTSQVKAWLKQNDSVKYVVLSSRFMAYYNLKITHRDQQQTYKAPIKVIQDEFDRTLVELEEMGLTPVIISPPPQNSHNIAKCLDKQYFYGADLSLCNFSREKMPKIQQDVHSWLRSLSKNYKTIMLDDLLCADGTCKTHFGDTFIYRDEGHLSIKGSESLGIKENFYDLIVK